MSLTLPRDPRYLQIAILGTLMLLGAVFLGFDISGIQASVTLGTALAAQWTATKLWNLPRFDPKSALISSLSLCLLLRTNSLWLVAGAAAVAIFSKFLIRFHDKHIFNPTAFALVLAMLTGHAWVSPGQWGSAGFTGLLVASVGLLVVYRSERSDITLACLLAYAAIVVGRGMWLGDPWSIAWHRLQSGAFLLFAFFMISDPKTTPDSRKGRLAFACLVAALGAYLQYGWFRGDGLIWALVSCTPLILFFDRLWPELRFQWPRLAPSPSRHTQPMLLTRRNP